MKGLFWWANWSDSREDKGIKALPRFFISALRRAFASFLSLPHPGALQLFVSLRVKECARRSPPEIKPHEMSISSKKERDSKSSRSSWGGDDQVAAAAARGGGGWKHEFGVGGLECLLTFCG